MPKTRSLACLVGPALALLLAGCPASSTPTGTAGGTAGGVGSTGRQAAGATGGSGTTTAGAAGSTGTGSGAGSSTGGTTSGGDGGLDQMCLSMCPVSRPYCDPTDPGNCVQCVLDRDCTVPNLPHCVTQANSENYGTCTQCTDSSQCPSGESCDMSLNACATDCRAGGACAAPSRCDPSSGACVTCMSAIECPSGKACVGGACGGCLQSSQCAPDGGLPLCNPEETCVQCLTDTDCPSGQSCSVAGNCQ